MKKTKFKLNQRHWLNIIIFIVSCMLLLSVLVGRMMNPKTSSEEINSSFQQVLQPKHATSSAEVIVAEIVQLDFGDIRFTKSANQWHSSNNQYSTEKIVRIVEAWQSILLKPGTMSAKQDAPGKIVLIYLAKLPNPLVAKISLANNEFQINFMKQNIQFNLSIKEIENYLPEN